MVSYALIAGLSTAILMAAMDDGRRLAMNLIADAVLLLIFIVYAKNAHVHNVSYYYSPTLNITVYILLLYQY